tara:strand:+ start:292 stop:495 length:204 start_codon:yes stop_codon:yes gene_type:complete
VKANKQPTIKYEDLNKWMQKYDGVDSEKILDAILNNKIKKEYMIDSINAYAKNDFDNADMFYKEMWI